MKRLLPAFALLCIGASTPASPQWTDAQVQELIQLMRGASREAITVPAADLAGLEKAAENAGPGLDARAMNAAILLLRAYRQGCCNASLRDGWHIAGPASPADSSAEIADALARDGLDALYRTARPAHPFFKGLVEAYAGETDASRRATLAANLDRWRWMPRDLGTRYLLVNTAAFEATLWQDGQLVDRWAVVVGKTRSPTPVFRARVSGVTFNPWWEIPPAIAAEGIARMIARRPQEAARRGYVRENGRYRQRPGPDNALGRVKLAMPNPYNVYLHDTPSQGLFSEPVRAFSHGCVRVGDALDLATVLLSEHPGWNRHKTDAIVATGATRTIELARPIAVYVAYFTAEPERDGNIRYFKDIYHRDRGAASPSDEGKCVL